MNRSKVVSARCVGPVLLSSRNASDRINKPCAHDTVIPMLISFLTIWLVQLPLAYIIPRYTGLAEYGVRWGMAIATVMGAMIYSIYFAKGRWIRKKL